MKTHAITTSIRRSILGGGILALASVSHAATVTWGAAQNITGDSDVSTAGTLVAAFNLGGTGVGNTTVNGTTFTGLALSGTSVTSGNFTFASPGLIGSSGGGGSVVAPFINLSASYQTMLSSLVGTLSPTTFSLTMNGLSVGASYQVQLWSNDSNGFTNSPLTATAGNSIALNSNASGVAGGLGQYGIGTFTADAASEVITFSTGNQALLNGVQLRNLSAVPEPGSALAGMLALGVCLSGVVKRSRRQAVEA